MMRVNLTQWLLLQHQKYCIDEFEVFRQVVKLFQVNNSGPEEG